MNYELFPRMSRINDKSHIGPQPNKRTSKELDILMANLQKRLETMCSTYGRGNMSCEDETHSLEGGDITNLLLLELLQKYNEQIQC